MTDSQFATECARWTIRGRAERDSGTLEMAWYGKRWPISVRLILSLLRKPRTMHPLLLWSPCNLGTGSENATSGVSSTF